MRVTALTSPVLVSVIACSGCAYKADSFSYASKPFRGVYLSVSCLDLGIERRMTGDSKNILGYQFGNRCDAPVVVDLAAATVYGDDTDGCDKNCKLAGTKPPKTISCPGLDVHVWGGAHKPSLASTTEGGGTHSAPGGTAICGSSTGNLPACAGA